MGIRAAVTLVMLSLCLGTFFEDAEAADARAYIEISFDIRDPYRDTLKASALSETVAAVVMACPDGLPMSFALYVEEAGGVPIWSERLPCVPIVNDGYVNILLGQTTALSSAEVTAHDVLYLEVTIDDIILTPRTKIIVGENALVLNVTGGTGPSPTNNPGADEQQPVVFSAGQMSLGAVATSRDPLRQQVVVFGDATLSLSNRTMSAANTQAAWRAYEQEKMIENLRAEITRLNKEIARARK